MVEPIFNISSKEEYYEAEKITNTPYHYLTEAFIEECKTLWTEDVNEFKELKARVEEQCNISKNKLDEWENEWSDVKDNITNNYLRNKEEYEQLKEKELTMFDPQIPIPQYYLECEELLKYWDTSDWEEIYEMKHEIIENNDTWFIEKYNIDMREDGLFNSMSSSGNTEFVNWMEQKYPDDFPLGCCAVDFAAYNGQKEMVEELDNKGYPCSTDAMDWAAAKDHLKIVILLHNKGKSCTTEAMDRAAGNGHLRMVEWLHNNRDEGCTTNALDWAMQDERDNTHPLSSEIVAFLKENRSEGHTDRAFKTQRRRRGRR